MWGRTVLDGVVGGGRLAFKEDHLDLLAAEDDGGEVVAGAVPVPAVVSVPVEARADAGEERAKHARAVAHVVVEVVARECEDVAREQGERAVRGAEHEQLRGEGHGLELHGGRLDAASEKARTG